MSTSSSASPNCSWSLPTAGSVVFDLGVEERGVLAQATYGSFDTERYVLRWAPEGESTQTFGVATYRSTDGFGDNRGSESASAMAQYWFGDEAVHGLGYEHPEALGYRIFRGMQWNLDRLPTHSGSARSACGRGRRPGGWCRSYAPTAVG